MNLLVILKDLKAFSFCCVWSLLTSMWNARKVGESETAETLHSAGSRSSQGHTNWLITHLINEV